jgi:hypothetical protein
MKNHKLKKINIIDNENGFELCVKCKDKIKIESRKDY